MPPRTRLASMKSASERAPIPPFPPPCLPGQDLGGRVLRAGRASLRDGLRRTDAFRLLLRLREAEGAGDKVREEGGGDRKQWGVLCFV